MSRREGRLRGAICEFLNEIPPPSAEEARRFVEAQAYHLGVPVGRATTIFQEEVNYAWNRTHPRDN